MVYHVIKINVNYNVAKIYPINRFVFQGHDTTATAITFGLMLLADHEEVQV